MLKIKRDSKTDINELKKDLDPIIQRTIYLEKSLYTKFKKKSFEEERSMSSIIQDLLREYVK